MRYFCKDGTPTEHAEQVAVIKWAEENLPAEINALFFAIPNGERTGWGTAKKTTAEGRKPGVPDLFLACARLGYHGLFIEMKREKGGTVSAEQHAMHDALRLSGYFVAVCHGAELAKQTLCWYLGIEVKP